MHRASRLAAALLLLPALGAAAGCGKGDQGDQTLTGVRITVDNPQYQVELLSSGDEFRLRLTPVAAGGQSWLVTGDGTDAVSVVFTGETPGPGDRFNLVKDMKQQPETEGRANPFLIPDNDEVPPLALFNGSRCHRVGTGTFASRSADRYTCPAVGGQSKAATVWVDQATRLTLTPWGFNGTASVDDHFEIPASTFAVTTPDGATVTTITPTPSPAS